MYRALVIASDLQARGRLQRVVESALTTSSVEAVGSLEEAVSLISREPFQLAYVAQQFGEKSISRFIECARAHPLSERMSFILVVESGKETKTTVADHMVAGIHGFLCEPVSVEAVEESSSLAVDVQRQHSKVRLKAAAGLILTSALDVSGKLRAIGQRRPSLIDQLRVTFRKLQSTANGSMTSFIDSVVDRLHVLPPSQRMEYDGPSVRVKKLLEKKLLDDAAEASQSES